MPVHTIAYTSLSLIDTRSVDLLSILRVSMQNNARDGITGVLWADRGAFFQLLEGPSLKVEACFSRVAADTRHACLRRLDCVGSSSRQFEDWSMKVVDGTYRRDLREGFPGCSGKVSADAVARWLDLLRLA